MSRRIPPRQPANTLQVPGVGRERILLMVVPPGTDPDIAHEAMMTAAAPGNASTVGDMLGIGDGGQEPPGASYRPAFSPTCPQVASMKGHCFGA